MPRELGHSALVRLAWPEPIHPPRGSDADLNRKRFQRGGRKRSRRPASWELILDPGVTREGESQRARGGRRPAASAAGCSSCSSWSCRRHRPGWRSRVVAGGGREPHQVLLKRMIMLETGRRFCGICFSDASLMIICHRNCVWLLARKTLDPWSTIVVVEGIASPLKSQQFTWFA